MSEQQRPTARRVTYKEQIEMGLRRPQENFVPAIRPQRSRQQLPAHQRQETKFDITPTATQHVEERTSHQDRAIGFLISNVPLFLTFSFAITLLAAHMAAFPLFSMAGALVLWVTFAMAWLISYITDISMSPSGIALFEAVMKWWILWREQSFRWQHMNRGND